MYLFMAELSSGVPAVFASGEVWESKFPFQTKKEKRERTRRKENGTPGKIWSRQAGGEGWALSQ